MASSSNISGNNLVLAIEAAVRGGSIALIENGNLIASWHGTEAVSRAEDLLWNIADLFERTQIDKHGVDLISVSNGPGSYTGIRIGLATAQGLANSLNIECAGLPLLPAIAEMDKKEAGCVVAIPIGRAEFCWQSFKPGLDGSSLGPPCTGSLDDLIEHFMHVPDFDLLLQHDAYEIVVNTPEFNNIQDRIYNCGRDLAVAIGIASRYGSSDMNPNYVRNSQFSSSAA